MSQHPESARIRGDIAALAARMIAEDGENYGNAKKRAARQLLGNRRVRGDMLPDNALIEEEVRTYQRVFMADEQPGRVLHLRKIAYELMQQLEKFNPHLTGAVQNGTAGAHSDIHLFLFIDSAKDVEMYLLNHDVQFETSLLPAASGSRHRDGVEVLSFIYRDEGVHLTCEDRSTGHQGMNRIARKEMLDIHALKQLIDKEATQ